MESKKQQRKEEIKGIYGTQVFIDVTITDCYQYGISLKTPGSDPRILIYPSFEVLKIFSNGDINNELDEARTDQTLTRHMSTKKAYFNVKLNFVEFRNMEYNPIVLFNIRKNPFNSRKPRLKLEARQYDENGNKIEYVPYDDFIDGFDNEIDIVKY